MQKVLMILGMHRSGTSLVTQWLSRCGLYVGSSLLGAGVGNADGHFEDEDFLLLHCEWLKNRGLPDSGLIHQGPGTLYNNETAQLKKLLAYKNAERDQWGWKEPRTCLWLPEYRQFLPDSFSLLITRSFNDTVNSLVMRERRIMDKLHDKKVQTKKGLSKLKWKYFKRKAAGYYFKLYAEEYLKVWIHYYEMIIAHCNSLSTEKYFLISYEELLLDDKSVIDQLTEQWQFTLKPIPFKDIFKKELLSNTRSVSKYIKNKELLNKALQLEAECFALSKKRHKSNEY